MRVEVRFYSLIRHETGKSIVEVEVPDGVRIKGLLQILSREVDGFARALEKLRGDILVLDSRGRRLSPEDPVPGGVVHVMPPPEGGQIECGVLRRGESVSLDELLSRAARGNTGAVVFFIGVVRRVNAGKEVEALEYEDAGDLTRDALERVVREVHERHKLYYAAAYHYTGTLYPGEKTMIVVVAAENRAKAYPALEELVERIKREVPIWKLERYKDGSRSFIVGGKRIEA